MSWERLMSLPGLGPSRIAKLDSFFAGRPDLTETAELPKEDPLHRREVYAVLNVLLLFPDGLSGEELSQRLRGTLEDEELLRTCEQMRQDRQLRFWDNRLWSSRLSIQDYAATLKSDVDGPVFTATLHGANARETGDTLGMTRQGIHLRLSRIMQRRPALWEDRYAYLFTHYAFTQEEFTGIFNEPPETYRYLQIASRGELKYCRPMEKALEDPALSDGIRAAVQAWLERDILFVDGVPVLRHRHDLLRHFAEKLAQEPIGLLAFHRMYHAELQKLGAADAPNVRTAIRSMERILRDSDYALWSQHRRFRWYPLEERDFARFLRELKLEEYQDVEIGAWKIFSAHPDLMAEYDIRDEYELHNLLRKLSLPGDLHLTVKRMPLLEFGQASRLNQILGVFRREGAIHSNDFARIYGERYGIRDQMVCVSMLQIEEIEFRGGLYQIRTARNPVPTALVGAGIG